MLKLKIGGKDFEFFSEFKFKLTYDAIASSFSFSVYFDYDNSEHR